MGDNTTGKIDWSKPDAYFGGGAPKLSASMQAPPRVITGENFEFTQILLDPQGNEIEPEQGPQPFVDWLEGLQPQDVRISYSGEKVPYLLAVYEAIPEWLGCPIEDMKDEYGYTPAELAAAFTAQKGPSSKTIKSILDRLIEHTHDVIATHEAAQGPAANATRPPTLE